MSDHDLFADLAPPTVDSEDEGGEFAKPWAVAGLAIGVGLTIDSLALHQPPGLGLALGLIVAVAVASSISVLMDRPTPTGTIPLAAAGLVLAAAIAVRTSPVLISLNVGAVLAIVAVLAGTHRAQDLRRWTISRYLLQPLVTIEDVAIGANRFVKRDLRSGLAARDPARVRAVLLGLVIGAPVVLVFTSLFASADAVFSERLDALGRALFLGSLFWRAFFSLLLAAAVAGLWRAMRDPDRHEPVRNDGRAMDLATAVTILSLVVGLFLFFVVTQVIGHDPDLLRHRDFSDNARQGFFQLVAVAFLVLNLLLALDWATDRGASRRSPAFDRLAVALIVLTGLVMTSALSRMRLYVQEYGLTELRFYTTVFMFWLAFVLAWFIGTVLRNRRGLFALGLFVSGLLFIVGLNVANPDALIVSANWQRHLDGANFSDRYNSELSLDSLETLVAIRRDSEAMEWCFLDRRLATEQVRLTEYRGQHGVLGDSWAAFRGRQLVAPLQLGDPSGYDCVDPRLVRARS